MNTEPTTLMYPSPVTDLAERLLELIRLSKEAADSIATDDHASMDEIEQSLAVAEVATLRLIMGIRIGGEGPGIVDIDEF